MSPAKEQRLENVRRAVAEPTTLSHALATPQAPHPAVRRNSHTTGSPAATHSVRSPSPVANPKPIPKSSLQASSSTVPGAAATAAKSTHSVHRRRNAVDRGLLTMLEGDILFADIAPILNPREMRRVEKIRRGASGNVRTVGSCTGSYEVSWEATPR